MKFGMKLNTDVAVVRVTNVKKASPYLSTSQAAFYVGLSPRTLETMRALAGGPKYRRHGRQCRYHIDDLDAWSASHSKVSGFNAA
jgi:hypothetical protein